MSYFHLGLIQPCFTWRRMCPLVECSCLVLRCLPFRAVSADSSKKHPSSVDRNVGWLKWVGRRLKEQHHPAKAFVALGSVCGAEICHRSLWRGTPARDPFVNSFGMGGRLELSRKLEYCSETPLWCNVSETVSSRTLPGMISSRRRFQVLQLQPCCRRYPPLADISAASWKITKIVYVFQMMFMWLDSHSEPLNENKLSQLRRNMLFQHLVLSPGRRLIDQSEAE